jgi:hypothetical protein
MQIEIRNDQKRGCGYRKPGGLYLVSDGPGVPCGRLPVALERCPTCDQGIKPSRGFTWVDAGEIMTKRSCAAKAAQCMACPTITGRHGLIWVGEQFYPSPEAWTREAATQGVSRRIGALPKDFQLGETWVLVAHRKAIPVVPCGEAVDLVDTCGRRTGHLGEHHRDREYIPGVFHAFKPSAIEYVVRGDETPEELDALAKRGITPVKVFVDGVPVTDVDDAHDDAA